MANINQFILLEMQDLSTMMAYFRQAIVPKDSFTNQMVQMQMMQNPNVDPNQMNQDLTVQDPNLNDLNNSQNEEPQNIPDEPQQLDPNQPTSM